MNNYFCNNLAFLRRQRKWSMDELALKIGVGKTTIKNYEQCNTQPDIDTLIRIMETFGVRFYEIVELDLANMPGWRPTSAGPHIQAMSEMELRKYCAEIESKLDTIKTSITAYVKGI
jgi:transcriptional regulator with XRE-family HTH domain